MRPVRFNPENPDGEVIADLQAGRFGQIGIDRHQRFAIMHRLHHCPSTNAGARRRGRSA